MFSFYRCLEVGKVAVVAPLSASYPVLTLLLSIFTGEHLSALRIFGIAAVLLGVILVAHGEVDPGEPSKTAKSGCRLIGARAPATISAAAFRTG